MKQAKYNIGDVVYNYKELVKHQEDFIIIINKSLKINSSAYAGLNYAAKQVACGPEQHTVIGYYMTSDGDFIYYLDDLDHAVHEQDVLTKTRCVDMLCNMLEDIKATVTAALELLAQYKQ
jgi:hypothetical protein